MLKVKNMDLKKVVVVVFFFYFSELQLYLRWIGHKPQPIFCYFYLCITLVIIVFVFVLVVLVAVLNIFLISTRRITALKVVVLREMARNNGSNCQFVNMSPAVKRNCGYSRLPITRTFKENRKKFVFSGVRVIGSSKKIGESKDNKKKTFLLPSEHFNHG